VVILARGLGTRMRTSDKNAALSGKQSKAAALGVKGMIPVGRPFLDYVLTSLADAGFNSACLVIGPEHQSIRDYYAQLRPSRISMSFAVQPQALGTANALLAAENVVGDDEFLTINADNYYPDDALLAIQKLGQAGAVLFPAETLVRNSNISPERIKEFACATVDKQRFLVQIAEKQPLSDGECLVSMNCWRFNHAIFDCCREAPLSERGEFELPLAVNIGIARGLKMKVATCHGGVLDLSRRSDIAAVASRLKAVQVSL
jgi:glucose-1-phosphate thymidylyltransferase